MPLEKARARILAAQRAFERERLALAPKDEDLRNCLARLQGGNVEVPSTQPRKSRLASTALQREYIRSQERPRRCREEKAKAGVVKLGAALALADYVPSNEPRIAEVANAENRRLCFENNAFKALVLSLGVDLPKGLRGRSSYKTFLSPRVKPGGQDVVLRHLRLF